MLCDTLTHATPPDSHPTHQSGWIATVMFFSQNVGSAIVMLITALLFTLVTALMALVLIKVSEHIRSKLARWHLIADTNTHCEPFLLPPPSVFFCLCFPCGRCTDCIVAGAAAWSVLSRSGAPVCGRAHLWGKQASTPLLRQPKARACPSTLLQCPATPTTVAGDSTATPLDGDRYSHTAGHFCDAREMTWKCHIISNWHDKMHLSERTGLLWHILSANYFTGPKPLLYSRGIAVWIYHSFSCVFTYCFLKWMREIYSFMLWRIFA